MRTDARRIGRIAVATALLGGAAVAQTAPEYYAAPDFPLTVRDWPDGPPAGALPPGAQPVEIGLTDDAAAWGRIIHGEGDAWVALDALRPVEPARASYAPIPAGLVCTGTEPFWALRMEADGAVFQEPGAEPVALAVHGAAPAAGMVWPVVVRIADAAAILRPAACHDGMSDRTYPWSVDLLDDEGLRSGCCRLPLPE
jgi:uncharacterized membrane protein